MTVAIARLLSSEEIGPSKYFEEYSPEAVNAWVNSPSAAHTLETRFTPDLFSGDFQVFPYHVDDDNLFVLVNRDNNELSKVLNEQFRVPALAKT